MLSGVVGIIIEGVIAGMSFWLASVILFALLRLLRVPYLWALILAILATWLRPSADPIWLVGHAAASLFWFVYMFRVRPKDERTA